MGGLQKEQPRGFLSKLSPGQACQRAPRSLPGFLPGGPSRLPPTRDAQTPACPQGPAPRGGQVRRADVRQRPCPSRPSRPGGGDAAPRAGSWVRKLPVFFLPSPSLLPTLPPCFLPPPLLSFPSPPFLSLPLSSQGRPPPCSPAPEVFPLSRCWH